MLFMVKLEKVRNNIDVKLVSNQKDYLKWTSKPNCMSKYFGNDLVPICNSKVTFILNRLAYVAMCILDVYEDFSKDKEMFDFSSYSAESTSYDSNKLVVGKMNDETGGVTIKEFAGSKSKMYFLAGDSSKHKKAKGVNENVVATISHGEYTDILLNKKCLTHSINRIQNKDHRIKT